MQPLPIHPACDSTPRRTDDEVNRLRDGLLNDGQTDPILTWRGQVIDGRHRQNILIAEGREPRYEARDDMTEAEVLSLIWSRLDVRTLTADQRAWWWELNHPKAEHGKQCERGNRHTSSREFPKEKVSSPLPAGITQKMIDQLSSLRRKAPALHEAVGAGKMKISTAYKTYTDSLKTADEVAHKTRHGGYIQPAIAAGLLNQQSSGPCRKALREEIAEIAGIPADEIPHANRDPEQAARVHGAIQALAAKKAGKTPDQRYKEHRREVATLPESAKAKFARLAATEKQLLESIFRKEVQAEALRMVPELRDEMERERDKYIHKNAALARIKAGVTPLITEADYRFLLGVLHPDRVPEDQRERFARAFGIVRKLDAYIEAAKA